MFRTSSICRHFRCNISDNKHYGGSSKKDNDVKIRVITKVIVLVIVAVIL